MRNPLFVSLSTLTLISPLAVATASQAQEPAPPGQTITPTPARPGVAARATRVTTPTWLNEKISVEVKDAQVADAVKKVLEAAKVSDHKVETDFEIPKDVRVSFDIKNVAARDALAAVARLGGAVAYVSQENGKSTVWLRKRTNVTAAPVLITGDGSPTMSVDVQRQVDAAMEHARRSIELGERNTLFTSAFAGSRAILPNKFVSLDTRNSDIREALKTVLKQADVDFALEDDVPEDVKKSFTFENVPISTALDVICSSANIGWRAERVVEPVEPNSKAERKTRTVVRVGKKHALPLRRQGLLENHNLRQLYTPGAHDVLFHREAPEIFSGVKGQDVIYLQPDENATITMTPIVETHSL